MTSSVRILTTASVDSTPSLLIIAPNGDKILVNCGEGCQRAFLEASGLRLKSVKRICLTHLHPTALGGLPGLVLTSADANESAIVALAAAEQEKAIRNQGGNQKKKGTKDEPAATSPKVGTSMSRQPMETLQQQTAGPRESSVKLTSKRPSPATASKEMMGGIEMHGPVGTQGFLDSLRHFMRRDRFETRVYEGEQQQPLEPARAPEPKKKKRKKNKNSSEPQTVDFSIQALTFQHSRRKESVPTQVPIQSYIFRTPSLVGKFRPDKAQKLGIPKGPMYSQLKNGRSVKFSDPSTGNERTVHSHEVLDAASPGVAVAVIYCPIADVLKQLKECKDLDALRNPTDGTTVDVMVHMTPIAQDADYQAWVALFPDTIDHIWLDTYETLQDMATKGSTFRSEASPFVGASLGGMMRSIIHREIHPSPIVERPQSVQIKDVSGTMIVGKRHLEYILIPRSKRGIKEEKEATLLEKIEEAKMFVRESGALERASKERSQVPPTPSVGEILFTGTGSALPCKHRNVTGICLTISESQRMLLDCGEGTVGQLFRVNPDMDMKSIQGVWISHPHADHHLGILRLLSERNSIAGLEPLILIAPPNLFAFLAEYEVIDPTVRGSYIKLDCYDLVSPSSPSLEMKQLLEARLGITSLKAVHVSHCRHAFAVVMDCNPGLGRVAYSGDCRPSMKFADLAVDADILIHEATFEDGMENEAVLKRHSTVGEALQVGKRMRAKSVLLTHFSQRYPRIPPLQASSDNQEEEIPVVFCFDFTRLTPATIPLAAKLTGALRLLYPEETDEKSKATSENGNEVDAKTIMAIPGMFAQSELL